MFHIACKKIDTHCAKIKQLLSSYTTKDDLASISIAILHLSNLLRETQSYFISSNINENKKYKSVYKCYKAELESFRKAYNDLKTKQEEYFEEKNLNFELYGYEENVNNGEEECVDKHTKKVNTFLLGAYGISENLKKQGDIIERTCRRAKNGLINLGASERIAGMLDTVYAKDRIVFFVGVLIIIFLLFFIKFVI